MHDPFADDTGAHGAAGAPAQTGVHGVAGSPAAFVISARSPVTPVAAA